MGMKKSNALASLAMFALMAEGMNYPYQSDRKERIDPKPKPLKQYNDKCYPGQKEFDYGDDRIIHDK